MTILKEEVQIKAKSISFKYASAWIYILTNERNTTLYVGVTNDMPTRHWEHRTKRSRQSFSAQYNLGKLVYFEPFDSIIEAIKREKYIKGKSRKWKEELVNSINPEWRDLIASVSI